MTYALRYGLAVMGTVAVMSVAGVGPSAAYTWFPYCGVYQDRSGAWACRFATYSDCMITMRAGNMGFCRENPTPNPVPPRQKRRRR